MISGNPAKGRSSQHGDSSDFTESVGGVTASHPKVEALPVLLATTTDKGKNTLRMDLIVVARWKINDVRFAFGSPLRPK